MTLKAGYYWVTRFNDSQPEVARYDPNRKVCPWDLMRQEMAYPEESIRVLGPVKPMDPPEDADFISGGMQEWYDEEVNAAAERRRYYLKTGRGRPILILADAETLADAYLRELDSPAS